MKPLKSKKSFSTEVKSSIIYIFSALFTKGLAFITIPIFTRIMPSSEIGVVNLYNSWSSLLLTLSTLALYSGGFSLAMKEFSQERSQYTSSVLSLTSLGALFLGLIYAISPRFWNRCLNLPTSLMLLIIAQALFQPANNFYLLRKRYEYKYISSGVLSALSALAATSLSVWVVLRSSKAGIEELGIIRLFSNYGVLLTVSAILWIGILKKGKTFYCAKYWRFGLTLSIPLIGNSFAEQILNSSDRIMIAHMVDNSAVGIYSTIYSCSSAALMVWDAINTTFIPYLFNNIEIPQQRKNIYATSSSLVLLVAAATFSLTLFAPEIIWLLAPEEYQAAVYIMPPVASGIFFIAISNMHSNILVYYKKTKYIAFSTVFAAFANILLNFLCIPLWGYMAAAYTTLFSYIIAAGMQVVIILQLQRKTNQNTNPIYNTKAILYISAITIICCLLCIPLYGCNLFRYILFTVLAGFFLPKVISFLKTRTLSN